VLRLDRPGAGPIGFDLINVSGTPFTGQKLGGACGSLIFADTGSGTLDPSTTSPPYSGTFKPVGDGSTAGFASYIGKPANGTYGLYPAFIADPITIQCFILEMDVK